MATSKKENVRSRDATVSDLQSTVQLTELVYTITNKNDGAELYREKIRMPTDTDKHWQDVLEWFRYQKRTGMRKVGT